MTHRPIRPGNDLPKHPKTARTTALVLTTVGALAWIGIIAAGIAYIWELTNL